MLNKNGLHKAVSLTFKISRLWIIMREKLRIIICIRNMIGKFFRL